MRAATLCGSGLDGFFIHLLRWGWLIVVISSTISARLPLDDPIPMSYLALARKYRPRTFDDVMGQSHVVKALSHALDGDRLHPAILLTGTRGIGKTTLARIIAKCLNCETGVSATPCGRCSACAEVDQGRCVDLLEIDAASNTGVDDVRQLIDNAQYAPARGRYKVYLIDEVHMLSKSAFNALLKTLEEPPAHVKFILATTDPQKLLVTVLSRCLQFNLKRLPVALIRDQLAKVLDAESVTYEASALAEIARAADGSMRDGLSLLDQAIAFAGGQTIAHEDVEAMLGTSGRARLRALLQALATRNPEAVLEALEGLDAQAPDYAALLSELATALQRLAMLQLLPTLNTDEDDAALITLKDRISAEDVQLYYQIAIHGRRDLPWAPDPRIGFEMTALRMLAFAPDDAAPSAAGPASGQAHGNDRRQGSRNQASAHPSTHSSGHSRAVPGDAPSAGKPLIPGRPLSAEDWSARVENLNIEGYTRQLARHCTWQGLEHGHLRLGLDAQVQHLFTEERRTALETALTEQTGTALTLTITLSAQAAGPTPAQIAQQREVERQQAAEQSMHADPVVRAFVDQFGASIKPGSIRALDS
ncbi:DNA polymerase III subunit gamma/tau [Sinimarinibacterium sp. NLF-5-8]|uniref:DNA polymerase III subunit gamma/tau n=1 Tax=Sinimarinibacterium sp. NLF-5-8 TaxID=2698684 RepID=UPI001EE48B56|nr:DNA polymerase III subunit gamma/tau [Sinimarinibacterium sp. NLF-5-8]